MIRNNKGYNLLMLTIMVLILSIVMSAVLRFYNITNYKRRILTTTSRFEEIDSAIKSYVAKYSRFPCPAPLNCNKNSCVNSGDSIGIERRDSSGNCVINNDGAFNSENSSSKNIYYGGIPALTLGLANNYIVDGWGNKIAYIIPEELTTDNSYHIFLYAKNHPNVDSIKINGLTHNIDREYIQDGIVYMLISFNKNTEGAYLYNNKRANYFSGKENYPAEDFTINTSNRKFLFYIKNYSDFKIEGLEEEMQICPDITISDIKTGNTSMTFYSGKYGEIIFSNEFCPSSVSTPAQAGDYYYLSTYRDTNGLLIDNRTAKKCGKNGNWESNFVYSCELLPKCVKPADDSRYSLLQWTNTNFLVSNMGEVQDDNNTIRLKCIYNAEDGAKWYQIN